MPGLVFMDTDLPWVLESRKMVKQTKRREQKKFRSKRQAERRQRAQQEHRRELRQEVRKKRREARILRKKELRDARGDSVPKQRKVKNPETSGNAGADLVDEKVRKVLMRAPIKAIGKKKVIPKEKKSNKINQSCGWKLGTHTPASEEPLARKSKQISTRVMTKLLKVVMKLAAKELAVDVSMTEVDNPEVAEMTLKPRKVMHPNSGEFSNQQAGLGSLSSEFSNQEAVPGSSAEEAGTNLHGVLLEDIGPDLHCDTGLTTSSNSESELKGGHYEEKCKTQRKPKRYKKRAAKNPNIWAESSDEEKEPFQDSETNICVKQAKSTPPLTESCDSEERPPLTASSDEEDGAPVVEEEGAKAGEMRGGAGESYEAILTAAIQQSGQHVVLDQPTPGDGSCFSHAIVQQCRRPPIKLFLQSRGVEITDFMQLKKNVAQFVQGNRHAEKIKNLWVNFEVSQLTMHYENMQRRSWRQYWDDMQQHGPWADETFLQATALYLNLDLRIIWASENSNGQHVTTVDGLFYQVAQGESRPLLYLGYIVNEHYQSLLPVVEDHYVPPGLAQPAVNNALQNALRALEDLRQGTQVSSSETKNHIKPIRVLDTQYERCLIQAPAAVQHSNQAQELTPDNDIRNVREKTNVKGGDNQSSQPGTSKSRSGAKVSSVYEYYQSLYLDFLGKIKSDFQ